MSAPILGPATGRTDQAVSYRRLVWLGLHVAKGELPWTAAEAKG